jgi:hypothetical protein
LLSGNLCAALGDTNREDVCRYLGEVGSTRLPLRSIAENTIGQKLTYEAINQENELPPLFAAIRSNTSIKVMSVVKMKGNEVLKVRHLSRTRVLYGSMPHCMSNKLQPSEKPCGWMSYSS